MNIKPKVKITKKAILVSTGFFVILGAIFGYMYVTKTMLFADSPRQAMINYGPATKDEIQAGEEVKKQNSDTIDSDKQTTGSDPSPSPAPNETGSKSIVSVEITSANQNGSTLNIRTLVQRLSSDGVCTLMMSGPDGKSYTATAKLQSGPSTGTCMGFDVPVASLSQGVWLITINYEDGSTKGTASKDVTVL